MISMTNGCDFHHISYRREYFNLDLSIVRFDIFHFFLFQMNFWNDRLFIRAGVNSNLVSDTLRLHSTFCLFNEKLFDARKLGEDWLKRLDMERKISRTFKLINKKKQEEAIRIKFIMLSLGLELWLQVFY